MHLIGVKEDDGWLFSRWELTYPAGWYNITKGVSAAFETFDAPEVLVRNEPVRIEKAEEILDVPENANMVIRGMSNILKIPVMIRFYNQLMAVDVNVPKISDKYKNPDYEKFNHSLCQFLDSIELAMHR